MLIITGLGMLNALDSISYIIADLFQKNEQMDKVAIASTLRGIVSVSAIFLTLAATNGIQFGEFLIALLWLVVMLGYDVRKALKLHRQWTNSSLKSIGRLLRTYLPSGFVGMLVRLTQTYQCTGSSTILAPNMSAIF